MFGSWNLAIDVEYTQTFIPTMTVTVSHRQHLKQLRLVGEYRRWELDERDAVAGRAAQPDTRMYSSIIAEL